jgi:hypothetical protein
MLRQMFSAHRPKLFLLTGDIEGITDHPSTKELWRIQHPAHEGGISACFGGQIILLWRE